MASYSTTTTSSIMEDNEKLLDKNFTIIINSQLGKGGFGQIFLGRYLKENKKIAIKVEENSNHSHLYLEYEILKSLQGGEGIPHIYKYRQGHKHNYLMMELLGKSLDRLFSDCKKHFSYKTIFQIGYQFIQRIEYVHTKGYIHRDIKPGNFVIGKNENHKKIYIIDFGLSKRYIDKNTNKSRRDDIEGIAFNLIYFAKGKLPWQGVKTKNKKEKHKKIMEMKLLYNPEKLCEGLSSQFACLLEYARDLKFEERPDYKHIKLMFKNSIKESGEDIDWIFDWDLLTEDKEKKIKENFEENDEQDDKKKSLNNSKNKNYNYKNEKNEE